MTKTEDAVFELIAEISCHPHREELLQLMEEQLADDTFVLPHQEF